MLRQVLYVVRIYKDAGINSYRVFIVWRQIKRGKTLLLPVLLTFGAAVYTAKDINPEFFIQHKEFAGGHYFVIYSLPSVLSVSSVVK